MKYQLFFSFDEFINSFVIEQSEDPNSIIEHALPGFVNRNLIGKNYVYGGKDFLSQRFKYAGDQGGGGIIASPSLLGAQLFLAAHGHLDITANQLCDSSFALEIWDEIKPLKGVMINQ